VIKIFFLEKTGTAGRRLYVAVKRKSGLTEDEENLASGI